MEPSSAPHTPVSCREILGVNTFRSRPRWIDELLPTHELSAENQILSADVTSVSFRAGRRSRLPDFPSERARRRLVSDC